MTNFCFSPRSENNLRGVHPDLVRVVRRALALTDVDFGITEGLRTPERQRQLVAAGKSQTQNSRHLTGHAVDVFAYPTPAGSWEWKYYAQISAAFKQAAAELNIPIEWGWRLEDAERWAAFPVTAPELPRMTNALAMLKNGGLLALLLSTLCLMGYSSLLSHRLESARQQAAELQKSLAQQAGLIATLQTQDARNRALMAAQQQQEQQLREQSDEYQRKYREAIKGNRCAAERMPDAVLELLRPAAGTGAAGGATAAP